MAATENIIIKFDVDGKELVTAQHQLEQTSAAGKKASESAKQFGKDFKQASADTSGSLNAIKSSLGGIAAGITAAFSVAAIVDFAKKSVAAFADAEKAAKGLEFAVKKLGKEGDAAVSTLKKLATQLSAANKYSIFDNDDIIKVEAMLSALGLTSKEITKLLPGLIDAASITGDLAGTADMFANAINGRLSPELKKLGINFDATGDQVSNYNNLVKESTVLTGAAGAALETAAGQAQMMEVRIGDLEESVGEKLTPVLQELKIALLSLAELGLEKLLGGDSDLDKSVNIRVEKYKNNLDIISNATEGLRKKNITESEKKVLETQITEANKNNARFLQFELDSLKEADAKITELKQRIKEKGGSRDSFNALESAKREKEILMRSINEQKAVFDAFNSKGVESRLGLSDEEKAKRNEAAKKAAEEAYKIEQEKLFAINDINKEFANEKWDNEEDKRKKDAADALKDEQDKLFAINDINREFSNEKWDNEEKARKEKIEADKKAAAQQDEIEKQAINAAVDAVFQAANAIEQIQAEKRQQKLELDLKAIEDSKQKELQNKRLTEKQKAEIDKKYEAEAAKIKTDAAKKQRQADINAALVNGALAIIKTFAEYGFTIPGIIAAAGQAVATGIQVAAIKSNPLPQYAKGTRFVEGAGTGTSDSITAKLSRGEAVITADKNRQYGPVLDAIHNGFVPADLLNGIALNYTGGKSSGINYDRLGKAVGKELGEVMYHIDKAHSGKQNIINVHIDGNNNHRKS